MKYIIALAIALVLAAGQAYSQTSAGGLPASFDHAAPARLADMQSVETVFVPAVNFDSLYYNARREGRDQLPGAIGKAVDIDVLQTAEADYLDDGSKVYRLRIVSPGALSLSLYFNRFIVPEGGRLFVYSEDRQFVKGAYSSSVSGRTENFFVSPLPYESIILEYHLSPQQVAPAEIHISRVYRGVKALPDFSEIVNTKSRDRLQVDQGRFGGSSSCHNNVNCPKGNDWCLEARAVCLITIPDPQGDADFCTGSLVNNTANDLTPYVLTAWHCLNENPGYDLSCNARPGGDCILSSTEQDATQNFVFDFHYWAPANDDCKVNGTFNNAITELVSFTGADLIASSITTDYALLKIREAGQGGTFNRANIWDYEIYYLGWTRATAAPTLSTCLHHPAADIMKISRDLDPAQTTGKPHNCIYCTNGQQWTSDYWHFAWDADEGTIEGGSSGAPVMDQNHRLIGQISGGVGSVCSGDNPTKNSHSAGKFHVSWGLGLSTYLDPIGSNPQTLDGIRSPIWWVNRDIDGNSYLDLLSFDNSGYLNDPLHYLLMAKYQLIFAGGTEFRDAFGATIRAGKEIVFGPCTHIHPRDPLVADGFVHAKIEDPPCQGDGNSVTLSPNSNDPNDWVRVPRLVQSDAPFAGSCTPSPKSPAWENPVVVQPSDPDGSSLKASPNPFAGRTEIAYTLGTESPHWLEIHDLFGRPVAALIAGTTRGPGVYRLQFDASGLTAGVYVLTLRLPDKTLSSKLIVSR